MIKIEVTYEKDQKEWCVYTRYMQHSEYPNEGDTEQFQSKKLALKYLHQKKYIPTVEIKIFRKDGKLQKTYKVNNDNR